MDETPNEISGSNGEKGKLNKNEKSKNTQSVKEVPTDRKKAATASRIPRLCTYPRGSTGSRTNVHTSKIPGKFSKKINLPGAKSNQTSSKVSLPIEADDANKSKELATEETGLEGFSPKRGTFNGRAVESFNDFKTKIKKTVESFSSCFMDTFKVLEGSVIHKEFLQKQAEMLREIEDHVNGLEIAHNVEIENKNQCNKEMLQQPENDLESFYVAKLEETEREMKQEAFYQIMQRDRQLAEMGMQLKMLEKEKEKLRAALKRATEEFREELSEKAHINEELKSCKEQIQEEIQLNREKTEKLEMLESKLKDTQGKLEEAKNSLEINQAQEGLQNKLLKLKNKCAILKAEKHKLTRKLDKLEKEQKFFVELRSRLLEVLAEQNRYSSENPNESDGVHQDEQSDGDGIKSELDVLEGQLNIDETENKNKINEHLQELLDQITEKNNIIGELSDEIEAKDEEFRIISTALNSHKLEFAHCKNTIKLLQENNDRNQMMRVELEEEIERLKEVIFIYKSIILVESPQEEVIEDYQDE